MQVSLSLDYIPAVSYSRDFDGLMGVNPKDIAVPRCGGDTARIILSSAIELGPYLARVVMTESRRTIIGGSLPVCWAIINRLYELDADGYEVVEETESIVTDAAALDIAYQNALMESTRFIQGALSEEVAL